MPIPLGILAVAGAGAAGGGGAYDRLATTILANNSTQSIEFTSLGSYSAYKHLQLRGVIQTQRSASSSDVGVLRFNGDAATNYTWHWLEAGGTNLVSEGFTSRTYARVEEVSTNSGGTLSWTPIIIDILDFNNTSKNKTVRFIYGHPQTQGGSRVVSLSSSVWMSTSAITSLTLDFTLSANNYTAGSRLSLYGVK